MIVEDLLEGLGNCVQELYSLINQRYLKIYTEIKDLLSWRWNYISVIPACGKLSQEGCYKVRPCLKRKTKRNKGEREEERERWLDIISQYRL